MRRVVRVAVVCLVAAATSGALPAPLRLARASDGGARGDAASKRTARSPSTMLAVCQDATARRCWIASSAAECGAPPAALFRLVDGTPGRPDLADALAACRDAARP